MSIYIYVYIHLREFLALAPLHNTLPREKFAKLAFPVNQFAQPHCFAVSRNRGNARRQSALPEISQSATNGEILRVLVATSISEKIIVCADSAQPAGEGHTETIGIFPMAIWGKNDSR
jgi:hypothetical protein